MKATDFLAIAKDFHLGNLPTEQQHPKTIELSQLAQSNCDKAVEALHEIDIDMLRVLGTKLKEIKSLSSSIASVFDKGGRVFLCGCGATGRLSLALETFWRQDYPNDSRVISFMAGGDVALISSIEKFEDYPEFGSRQLVELGFKEGDLLLASTEGGETPWVIGAAEKAAEISSVNPYFLYCNPDEVLEKTVERSRRVLENSKIKKINLSTGPMALSGSTRMQASSILMYAIGLALFHFQDCDKIEPSFSQFESFFKKSDLKKMTPFILKESSIYEQGEYLYYDTDPNLGITILTDTTERSPTFSLFPFENQNDPDKDQKASLVYLKMRGVHGAKEAWEKLLYREARTFKWKEAGDQTTSEKLLGFNISEETVDLRSEYLKGETNTFSIYQERGVLSLKLGGLSLDKDVSSLSTLEVHMLLKMVLNIHSTLVMGRLKRYEGNLMTWVRTSNNKLIDRAIRYTEILLRARGVEKSYEEIAIELFKVKEDLPSDQPLVMTLVERMS
ncbi:MAG: N-acetylmuramic acid 6-phosphate etherase [Bacteriovoracaceae bacterium]